MRYELEDLKPDKEYKYKGSTIIHLYKVLHFFAYDWHYNPYNGHEINCDCKNCREWEKGYEYYDDEDLGYAVASILNHILE